MRDDSQRFGPGFDFFFLKQRPSSSVVCPAARPKAAVLPPLITYPHPFFSSSHVTLSLLIPFKPDGLNTANTANFVKMTSLALLNVNTSFMEDYVRGLVSNRYLGVCYTSKASVMKQQYFRGEIISYFCSQIHKKRVSFSTSSYFSM